MYEYLVSFNSLRTKSKDFHQFFPKLKLSLLLSLTMNGVLPSVYPAKHVVYEIKNITQKHLAIKCPVWSLEVPQLNSFPYHLKSVLVLCL